MVYYIKYFITSSFHVIIWTDAAEHWRQTEIGPRFMARVSMNEKKKFHKSPIAHIVCHIVLIEMSKLFTNPKRNVTIFQFSINCSSISNSPTCLPFDTCSHELCSVSWSHRRALCIFSLADTRSVRDYKSVRHQLDTDLSLKIKGKTFFFKILVKFDCTLLTIAWLN